MNICYVNKTIATLYEITNTTKTKTYEATEKEPEKTLVLSAIADECLYGSPLLILEETEEFYKVRTYYSYEGYIYKRDVIVRDLVNNQKVINGRYVDVLSVPKVQGVPFISLTRGCLIQVTEEITDGYRKVVLLDGREGYLPEKYLMDKKFDTNKFSEQGTMGTESEWKAFLKAHLETYFNGSEEQFRNAVCDTAIGYVGTQYRWGGKTPLGIDCSGTTSMSYMLNGILTYRDAKIVEGYPVKEIPRSEMKRGDLLYFTGHIAMYLGNDMFIHSTGRTGSNGVDVNSFNPKDTRYRKDLDEGLLKVGTIFW